MLVFRFSRDMQRHKYSKTSSTMESTSTFQSRNMTSHQIKNAVTTVYHVVTQMLVTFSWTVMTELCSRFCYLESSGCIIGLIKEHKRKSLESQCLPYC